MGHEVVKYLTRDVHNELLHVLKKVRVQNYVINIQSLQLFYLFGPKSMDISALIYWNKIISLGRQKQSN